MAQSQGHRPAIPVPGARVLHGPAVRRWIALAEIVADQTRDLVDVLNVFPVPDADTGTNVLLTLRSASDALHRLGWAADAAQVARAAADGAVRGARGNSGLLVSQALAAFADVCADTPDPAGLRPVELVHAYEAMADTTWAAVSRPVAGTLLSVARDAATAARAALEEATASSPATLSVIAAAAAFGSQESVVETAGLGHGPVDAGGAAFMLLLTCLSDTIDAVQDVDPGAAPELRQGDEDADEHAPYTAVARQMLTDLAKGGVPHSVGPEPLGMSTGEFEVMYLLEATAVQAGQLRRDLELIGDSVGVVGTPDALGVGLYQVHVHTDTPRAALPHAGRARQICIHHLHPTALVASTDEPPSPWGALDSDPMGHVVSFERLAARRAERKAKSVRMHPSQAAMPQPAPVEGPRLAARSREAGVGVIACTRAPGLIEQLARSDAPSSSILTGRGSPVPLRIWGPPRSSCCLVMPPALRPPTMPPASWRLAPPYPPSVLRSGSGTQEPLVRPLAPGCRRRLRRSATSPRAFSSSCATPMTRPGSLRPPSPWLDGARRMSWPIWPAAPGAPQQVCAPSPSMGPRPTPTPWPAPWHRLCGPPTSC